MAEDQSTHGREPAEDASLEAGIPMKKASPMLWVALGGGAVVIAGLVAVGSGGGDEAKAEAAGLKAEQAANSEEQITAKEAREHLVKTQKALAAAEAEAASVQNAQAEAPRAEPDEPTQARPAEDKPAPVAQKPAAAKASSAPSKKKMESLDSLGADITSALK